MTSLTTEGSSLVEFAYDSLGRINERKTTLLNRPTYPLTINYLYDSLSRVSDVIYPTPYNSQTGIRKTVHYDFDMAGRMNSLKVDGVAYASDFVFNADDQMTSVKIEPSNSNQINELYDYSAQTGLLQNQKVLRAGVALLDLSYEYESCSCSTGGTGKIKRIINNW